MLFTFWYFIKAEWQASLTYRSMLAIWMFGAFFPSLVMLSVWLKVLEGQVVPSFSRQMFVTYYLLMPLVRNFTGAWAGFYLPKKIRDGELLSKLTKPIHPIFPDLANNLAEKFTKTWFILPMVLLTAFVYQVNPFVFSANQLILAIIIVSVGLVILFLLDWLIGLLGFWLLDPQPLRIIDDALSFLFGGQVLPLVLFPDWLKTIAYFLPYRYAISLPMEVLTGTLPLNELVPALAVQAAWLVGLLALLRFTWQRGLRTYQAYGG